MLTQKLLIKANNYYIDKFQKVANNVSKDALFRDFKIRGTEWYELNIVRKSIKLWKEVSEPFLKSEEHREKIEELFNSKVSIVEDEEKIYIIPEKEFKKYTDYVNLEFSEKFKKKIDDDEDIKGYITDNYAEAKVTAEQRLIVMLKKVGCAIEIEKQDIGYDFTGLDERAIESVLKSFFYWIGDTYNRSLSDRINDIAKRILNSGLGEKDMADVFYDELGDEYGKSRHYFTILASNVANASRVYGALNTYYEYEVEEWEYLAILDDRTTEICEYLDGSIYSVERAIGVIKDILNADDPDDIKSIKPFLSWDDERGEPYYETETETLYIPLSGSGEEVTSTCDFSFPPNHILCRSTVIPYFRTEIRDHLPMLEKLKSRGIIVSNY